MSMIAPGMRLLGYKMSGMRLSEGVEWTIHCLVVLATLPEDAALPAARLAEFHGVPRPYLAKHLQALARAGLVRSDPGPRGGYRLGRHPGEINLLDVVLAIEGPEPAFRCTEIRQRGPAAVAPRQYVKPCLVHQAMARAEQAWRQELARQTLADLAERVGRQIPPESYQKAERWLGQVLKR
jgi:Rrf2 family protein